ncbi:DUF2577 family protein [Terribacillus sp. 7520-G]|uniref:DUF2577 family protein n=1 Tax=Terribacillus TaxID=459532 RepID=UPI000BA680B8|nr:DUF2577 family protein [Terribacillus sp. 7520-G]PAD38601.1 phage portal protein [Terribacillus sp. 7520-G]
MRMADAIKILAKGAVNAGNPIDLLIGEVVSVSPLEVRLRENNKLVIPEGLISVADHLKDRAVMVEIDGEEKKMRMKSELNNGDKVMIASLIGGQSFFLFARI